MVRVSVLGPLLAWVDDQPVDLGTPRQRAVLARLVGAAGAVVPTDRLLDDLWEGEPPPRALGTLQVYVSHLRRTLEPDRPARTPASVLISAAPGYALRLAADDVDAWRFERLVSAALERGANEDPHRVERLAEEALALWRGPAYAEFADERWAQPEAARLEDLRMLTIELRADAAMRLGHASRVVPDLERHVHAHPLREEAVALLALALYRCGRQADALALLRRARQRLADELGVDPGPALRALETDVLHQAARLDQPAPPRRTTAALAPVTAVVPQPAPRTLIGRAVELDRLSAIAERVRAGAFHVVWLGGEAGIGKTALAEAFTAQLGWASAWGRCPEVDGAPPAWAWSEALRELVGRVPPAGDLAGRLAPLLDQGGGPTPEATGQFWLARAVADYLAELAAQRPLLVVLDDIHRADEETLQVLRQVAAALVAAPVLVVATFRPTEVADQLGATWAALAGPNSETVELAGLAEADAITLLRQHSGVDLDETAAHAVAQRTGGNPLFVCESGRLIAAEGATLAVAAIPAGVRSVLRRRIARLPAKAQTVLRNAAVLGRDIDVDLLLAAEGADEETVLDALEAAVLTGLLVEPAPGRVRFMHEMVRETLYQDTPLLRRVRLHSRVLAAIEQTRPGDVAALARHALAAAQPATAHGAVRYAVAAAGQATGLYAHREAAALLGAAIRTLDLAPDQDPATRLDLLCRLLSAQARSGDVLAAQATTRQAIAVARGLGDPAAMARVLTAFDAPVTWTTRENRQVDAALVEQIEATLDALTAEAEQLRGRLLTRLVFEVEGSDDARADAASTQALGLARAGYDPRSLCRALNARYFVALAPHRRHEMPPLGEEMLAVATGAGLLDFQMQAYHILCLVALDRTDLAQAKWYVDRAVEHSTTAQLGQTLTILRVFHALRAVVAGRFEEAEQRYTELAAEMSRSGGANAEAVGVIGRFFTRLAAGRARDSVPELLPYYEVVPVEVADLLTRALIDADRVDEARRVWAPQHPIRADYYWSAFMGVRAENAVRLGDRATAQSCYDALLPFAGQLAGLSNGSVTGGPVDLVLGDIATLLDRPDDAARHYAAAEELANRLGARHWADPARRLSADPARQISQR